jgi:hypothetical protein
MILHYHSKRYLSNFVADMISLNNLVRHWILAAAWLVDLASIRWDFALLTLPSVSLIIE